MSGREEHTRFSEDLAAYALRALPDAELDALQRHAEICVVCRDELAAHECAASALALGVPQRAAPTALRGRILASVAAEVSGLPGAQQRAPTRARVRMRVWAWRPASVATAAALALGIALGALLFAPGPATSVIRARVAGLAAWHGSTLPVAELERTGAHAVLDVEHLPAAGAGKVYEVWIERGDHPYPTDALFDATRGGQAVVAVPGNLAGASAVLVTAEPLGGTKVPTMAPLITAVLS
jgi:anti-sigma-K factor RskA